mmetsp:Transcript_2425/g.5143  ORF Transcript_2425/g.5143 Transcript_2425/m.5143 type:complete len:90 (+) Transcript_2425:390-659(+)
MASSTPAKRGGCAALLTIIQEVATKHKLTPGKITVCIDNLNATVLQRPPEMGHLSTYRKTMLYKVSYTTPKAEQIKRTPENVRRKETFR